MNKVITIIAVLAIVFLGGVLIFNSSPENDATTTGKTGAVLIAITDAAANMENISEITMSAQTVAVHSKTQGWVRVSEAEKQYNLLALNSADETKLYARADIPAGSYNKVRMAIGDVTVTTEDGSTHEVLTPNSEITVDGAVEVSADATSTVTVDIKGDQSLHTTTDGSFVFAPVIEMEARSGANVSVDNQNRVQISGGDVTTNVSVGLDLNGTSKTNFRVDPNATIEVTADGTLQLSAGSGNNTGSGSATGSAEGSVDAGVEADVDATTTIDTESTDTDVDAEASGGMEAETEESNGETGAETNVEGSADVQY